MIFTPYVFIELLYYKREKIEIIKRILYNQPI